MQPYEMLEQLYVVNSIVGTYVKSDGERFAVRVEPENVETDGLTSPYAGAVTFRAWSCAVGQFKDVRGILYFPGENDLLIIDCLDGKKRTYKTCRDSYSSKFWRWKWDRPGGRIVFFTRLELEQ